MGRSYVVCSARPDGRDREKKEMDTYDLLERLQIPYERLDHEEAMTMEDCSAAETALGVGICKNLFLCNAQKTRFYLLMMPGQKRFKTRELSAQIGSARLSFAGAELMERYLNVSPGSVSVMALMNDRGHAVQLLIDRELAAQEYLGCHPCVNTASLKIRMSDLLGKFLPHTGHAPVMVDLRPD